MRKSTSRVFLVIITTFLGAGRVWPQTAQQPAYLNTALPAEQRAADLVHRMTRGRKGHATGQPVARHPAAECSRL